MGMMISPKMMIILMILEVHFYSYSLVDMILLEKFEHRSEVLGMKARGSTTAEGYGKVVIVRGMRAFENLVL
jgi:hypothetical protein